MAVELADVIAAWGLIPDGPPSATATGLVQRVRHLGAPALLKLPQEDDERNSAAILAWYGGEGCVRLLRARGEAQLLEWIDGRPLSSLVRAGRDDEAAGVLAEVVAKLHAGRGPAPAGLIPLEVRMQPLLERGGSGDPLHQNAAALIVELLGNTPRTQPLHGDIHHDNVLHHAARGWLAIDPKGLLGDRHYDLANALCNPLSFPDIVRDRERVWRQARILAEHLSLDADRLIDFAFCHACLAEIWCVEDGEDSAHWRAMGEIVGRLRRGR